MRHQNSHYKNNSRSIFDTKRFKVLLFIATAGLLLAASECKGSAATGASFNDGPPPPPAKYNVR